MKSMGELAPSEHTNSQLNVPSRRGDTSVSAVTGERERPVKKESAVVKEGGKNASKTVAEPRGTKL